MKKRRVSSGAAICEVSPKFVERARALCKKRRVIRKPRDVFLQRYKIHGNNIWYITSPNTSYAYKLKDWRKLAKWLIAAADWLDAKKEGK